MFADAIAGIVCPALRIAAENLEATISAMRSSSGPAVPSVTGTSSTRSHWSVLSLRIASERLSIVPLSELLLRLVMYERPFAFSCSIEYGSPPS